MLSFVRKSAARQLPQHLSRAAACNAVKRAPGAFRAFSGVPKTMKAAVVHETGPASALKIEAAWPVPAIADGQVLVKNEFRASTSSTHTTAAASTSVNCPLLAARRVAASLPP